MFSCSIFSTWKSIFSRRKISFDIMCRWRKNVQNLYRVLCNEWRCAVCDKLWNNTSFMVECVWYNPVGRKFAYWILSLFLWVIVIALFSIHIRFTFQSDFPTTNTNIVYVIISVKCWHSNCFLFFFVIYICTSFKQAYIRRVQTIYVIFQ